MHTGICSCCTLHIDFSVIVRIVRRDRTGLDERLEDFAFDRLLASRLTSIYQLIPNFLKDPNVRRKENPHLHPAVARTAVPHQQSNALLR